MIGIFSFQFYLARFRFRFNEKKNDTGEKFCLFDKQLDTQYTPMTFDMTRRSAMTCLINSLIPLIGCCHLLIALFLSFFSILNEQYLLVNIPSIQSIMFGQ